MNSDKQLTWLVTVFPLRNQSTFPAASNCGEVPRQLSRQGKLIRGCVAVVIVAVDIVAVVIVIFATVVSVIVDVTDVAIFPSLYVVLSDFSDLSVYLSISTYL